ncbi:DNA primase [Weissella diestrammenae]|uniref:DNA primase n=1 Tax=Weissella diestrammenae TaxID=1162633 RepID=A0A7G9T5M2_9LACO|nr:DNA primase [Weissella diestrammenae]MCM0582224.1 DNA primase [Weissella diestrammenae]QNN75397.1 DNA primase [Weissella diestrammenae]
MTIALSIPNEIVENIRQNVNIVDIISPYVSLKKQGRNLFGKCPWHEERTPSFSVNEDKQIFHCFSCGRGGNAFVFLMEKENLSFPQAVAKVAEVGGIPLDASYSNPTREARLPENERQLLKLYDEATKFYHHLLINTEIGDTALQYLYQRGVDDATIDAFMLGYAPTDDVLLKYVTEKKYDYQLLRESELFIEWDDGSLHDRFTDRVLFTIRNQTGAPIAFSGRRLSNDADVAKYMNSPESILFNKSNELFNLDLAKNDISKSKTVILFEGFMDVIAAFQAGIRNGVASMGTSLTQDQVQRLNRIAQKINITYDSDNAGQAATQRALELIGRFSQMKAQVIHIPDTQDPDEFLRSQGVEAFQNVLQHNTEDPIAFNLRYLKGNYDLNNQVEIFSYIREILPIIASVNEPVVRQTYLQKLASEFNLNYDGLNEQLQPLLLTKIAQNTSVNQEKWHQREAPNMPSQSIAQSTSVEKPKYTRLEQAERTLFAWMLKDLDIWLKVTSNVDFHFVDVAFETLLMLASDYKSKHQLDKIVDLAGFMNFVKEPGLIRILASLDQVPDELMRDSSQVPEYLAVILQRAPLTIRISKKRKELSEAKQIHNDTLAAQISFELIALLREQELAKLSRQNKGNKYGREEKG